MAVDKTKIEKAVSEVLNAIEVEFPVEVYQNTPARVARAIEELTSGYDEDTREILSRTFPQEGEAVVIERDIPFSSTCEHHLMPFFGKVSIVYISQGKVVGLSKLARVVDVYAKRFQLQERMTAEIADAIYDCLSAKGVMVVATAEHTCMTARGVKKMGAKTTTTAIRGEVSADIRMQMTAID